MSRLNSKSNNAFRRKNRVRSTLDNVSDRVRLSVLVSNRHVAAQIIDDTEGKTLVSSSSLGKKSEGNLTDIAASVGSDIAKKAKAKKISEVKFDRGAKLYHGRIKAFAEAARKEGLKF